MNFKEFIDIKGLDAEGILNRLPSMTFDQQAEVDKKLHNMAIGHGDFGSDSVDLAQDESIKTNFQRILSGERDEKLIQSTIAGLRRDQKGHMSYLTQYPETELTGDRKWHSTWIAVYDKWIAYLRKLI
jgi:hypothetical protein